MRNPNDRKPDMPCKAFPWNIEIEWFGHVGVHQLPDRRIARIELSTQPGCESGIPSAGHYTGFVVTIVSKDSGRIDSCSFHFSTIMDSRNMKHRTDRRPDYTEWFYISSSDWDWYIARPLMTQDVVRAVERYITQWM